MDFSKVLNQDEGLSLTVRLKWFPVRLDEEYVSGLPHEVQVALCPHIGLGALHRWSDTLPSVISMRINAFYRYKISYYQHTEKLLCEYEFKRAFGEHENDAG
jgi:hypothetical protein